MVDFVDLANGHRYLLGRILDADDDFAKIDYPSQPQQASSTTAYYDATSQSQSPMDYAYVGSTPVLSKSAEAELYLLATNFLLCTYYLYIVDSLRRSIDQSVVNAAVLSFPENLNCYPLMQRSNLLTTLFLVISPRPVPSLSNNNDLSPIFYLSDVAMVIITIMVAKIYFPESLKRGQLEANFDKQRPYSYRRKSFKDEGNNNSSEEEDLILEYDDLELEDDDDLNALYSDDDEEFLKSDDSSPSGDEASWLFDSDHNFLEFDQEQTSRSQVIKRLLFCSLMLNITFVAWGVLQERMLTRRYPRHTGDFFTYSYALVFSNRFWTLVMSGMLLLWLKPRASRTTILYEYSFPSISNMLSSWCQYEALRYLSFPATTIFKSFKLAPVMLMGKLLGNKTCKFVVAIDGIAYFTFLLHSSCLLTKSCLLMIST